MNSIHHIALHCHDIHAQEQFYSRHFGFRRVWTFNEGTPNEFRMLGLDSCRLELFSAAEGTSPEERGGEQKIGFMHLALSVPNLEEAVARLKEDGIIADPIIPKTPVPGLRICFFRDPEGNILELMENWPEGH